MNAERLLKLADHLEKVVALQPATFDMDSFGSDRPCGTTCCALAHACSIPEFAAEGLKLQWLPSESAFGHRSATVVLDREDDYEALDSFDAAEKFFDISEESAGWLFGCDDLEENGRKLTPLDVAGRIRELAKGQTT